MGMPKNTHLHHIIPKHAGGSDDPSNLVELTIEEHAEAHRQLYETHGRLEDKLAWQGLSKMIGKPEILQALSENKLGEKNSFYGKEHTEETRRKISQSRTGKGRQKKSEKWKREMSSRMSGENNPAFGKTPWNKGKKLGSQSAECRRKKGRPLVFRGMEYNSLNEAENLTGISCYYIKKECRFL